MVPVPNPHKRPLTEVEAKAEFDRLITDAYRPEPQAPVEIPTSYRDDTPVPSIGTAPPVPQPGRAPMSERASDISGITIAVGWASVPISAGVSLIVWTSGHVNPVVVGIVFTAPIAFLGVLSRVVKRAKEVVQAAPPVIHQHYSGPVHQDHSSHHTETRNLIANTRNELHP